MGRPGLRAGIAFVLSLRNTPLIAVAFFGRKQKNKKPNSKKKRTRTDNCIKGPKGPEPALVSLISPTMVVVVFTAAAVSGSEALRGHLDSRRGVPLSGLFKFEGDATRT